MRPKSYMEIEVPNRCGRCAYCKLERIQSEDYVYECTHPSLQKAVGEGGYANCVNPVFGKCQMFKSIK